MLPQPYPSSNPTLPAGMEAGMTAFSNRMLSEAEIDAIETGISEWRLLGIINYTDDNHLISLLCVRGCAPARAPRVITLGADLAACP